MGDSTHPTNQLPNGNTTASLETAYTVGSTIRLDTITNSTSRLARPSTEDSDADQRASTPLASSSSAVELRGLQNRPKWWHVPDEKIDQLIERAGKSSDNQPNARSLRGARSVRFDEPPEDDALDRMLRRTADKFAEHEPPAEGEGQLDKWWKVSDDRIMEMVLGMSAKAANPDGVFVHSGKSALGKATSSSARSLANSRACASRRREERLVVQIEFIDSGDMLTLKVPPDMRLGPATPPKTNRFTDIFGQGATTKGFDKKIRSFDYGRKQFGSTQREQWSPEWTTSLKAMIQNLTQIEASRQKFFHRQSPMTSDETSLTSYGVRNGEVLQLQIQKWTPGAGVHKDVVLACTKRKRDMIEQRKAATTADGPKYDGYTLRDNKNIREYNRADGDVWMMPRWISQSCPNLFAPVGCGLDGDGGMQIRTDFASMPIYLTDRNDSKLSRVREVVTGHQQYVHLSS